MVSNFRSKAPGRIALVDAIEKAASLPGPSWDIGRPRRYVVRSVPLCTRFDLTRTCGAMRRRLRSEDDRYEESAQVYGCISTLRRAVRVGQRIRGLIHSESWFRCCVRAWSVRRRAVQITRNRATGMRGEGVEEVELERI